MLFSLFSFDIATRPKFYIDPIKEVALVDKFNRYNSPQEVLRYLYHTNIIVCESVVLLSPTVLYYGTRK
jgi:hypothetical protein